MSSIIEFENHLSADLRETLHSLSTPSSIQAYLDSLPYIAEELDRSPLRVMQDRQCHCLDGGIFAALALWRIGYSPLLLDLVPEPGLDDDHVLALYSVNGLWGCLAKSNYPVLRSREPVYRTMRELSMSYFDFFLNTDRVRSLRGYTRPLDLSHHQPDWMWTETGVARISKALYSRKPVPLIPPDVGTRLNKADDKTYQAASLGTDFNWAYGIRKDK